MSAPLCFLDTETTGVHPGRRVWEIGMIRREPDGTEKETQFFVEVDLSIADPFGLNIGGFYQRHPFGQYLSGRTVVGPRPGECVSTTETAKRVARWTHGAHIVGAVPNFDTEVLGKMLGAHGLVPAWHYHLIDVEALALGYIAGVNECATTGDTMHIDLDVRTLPWKSHALSAAIGVESPVEDEHTALGDARWAMRVYDAVMSGGAS